MGIPFRVKHSTISNVFCRLINWESVLIAIYWRAGAHDKQTLMMVDRYTNLWI